MAHWSLLKCGTRLSAANIRLESSQQRQGWRADVAQNTVIVAAPHTSVITFYGNAKMMQVPPALWAYVV
eukprot:2749000-Pyramimonas_sp.AAC.1